MSYSAKDAPHACARPTMEGMPPRSPHARPLTELVVGLGSGLAEVVTRPPGTDPVVDDIALAEPATGMIGIPGDLVLGVGIASDEQAHGLVEAAARRQVAGLALRRSLLTPALTAAARDALALVAVSDEASWAHLAWLLRELLDRADAPPEGGRDELFTLADACAALLGAPVTIEDTRSRVLAYSETDDRTDPIRISTIIGRRVPATVVASLRARGVFRHLVRSTEPLFLPAATDGSLGPRFIVPVHAGGEWVGSIWAMVDGPVPEQVWRPMREVAAVVALHLVRLRSQSDLGRRLMADQLRDALAGHAAAATTALPAPPWRVAILAADPDATTPRSRVSVWESAFRRAAWQRPHLVEVDDDVVAIVAERPGERATTDPGTWPWLRTLVERLATAVPWAWVVACDPVRSAADLGSGLGAARELARLRRTGLHTDPVTTTEQAWAPLVVSRAVTAITPAGHSGPPATTRAGTVGGPMGPMGPIGAGDALDPPLVRTLQAWLDHPGDTRAAAAVLHVHPNTVRYRLGQIRAMLGVDLADPTVRLALGLQVRAARTVHPRYDAPEGPGP